jgi:hypothetical protein
MRNGPRSMINFNDFHVPFSDADIREISAEMSDPELKRGWSHGEGMNDFFGSGAIEQLLDSGGLNASGEGEGYVKFDHMIVADEGTTMKGEDIAAVIEESKKTGVPIGTLLRRGRIPNVTVRTVATPGPGVVEQTTRSGRGGKKISSEDY